MKNTKVDPKRFYKRGHQVDFRFLKTPRNFYYNRKYHKLSLGARSLYVILSDRMSLSLKNEMIDEEGYTFVLFKTKPAQDDTRRPEEKPEEDFSLSELLNVNPKSIKKYKEELIRHELLVEKRRGLGKVNRLYVLIPEEAPISRKPIQLSLERDAYKKNFPALCGEVPLEGNISPLYQMSSRG
ncbi:replication initiator protein A [Isachenkonia alkalipeptolytica]|uniref:Replication initiator A N-terminal domain-containing protein n=1 Tax=Isachenkonia alkalipeptolytica TaxID=2565777 RepID=A0AA44BE49_9CLOT|nr:replication initiator protein A [Isachenkonia alkalipeptolytica]NBG88647.1 hypothetical protein [Isachenkonia alkalipeptolytica]